MIRVSHEYPTTKAVERIANQSTGWTVEGQASAVLTSRLVALGLQVHDRMAGMFLPFAGFGEEAMHVMAPGGG
jgi:hypothetical protein